MKRLGNGTRLFDPAGRTGWNRSLRTRDEKGDSRWESPLESCASRAKAPRYVLFGVADRDDIGIEGSGESVGLPWAHDERMIALEDLQVVQVSIVRAVGGVVGNHFGLLPSALEVVLLDRATKSFGSQHRR